MRKFFLLFVIFCGLSLTSCDKDDEYYRIRDTMWESVFEYTRIDPHGFEVECANINTLIFNDDDTYNGVVEHYVNGELEAMDTEEGTYRVRGNKVKLSFYIGSIGQMGESEFIIDDDRLISADKAEELIVIYYRKK